MQAAEQKLKVVAEVLLELEDVAWMIPDLALFSVHLDNFTGSHLQFVSIYGLALYLFLSKLEVVVVCLIDYLFADQLQKLLANVHSRRAADTQMSPEDAAVWSVLPVAFICSV